MWIMHQRRLGVFLWLDLAQSSSHLPFHRIAFISSQLKTEKVNWNGGKNEFVVCSSRPIRNQRMTISTSCRGMKFSFLDFELATRSWKRLCFVGFGLVCVRSRSTGKQHFANIFVGFSCSSNQLQLENVFYGILSSLSIWIMLCLHKPIGNLSWRGNRVEVMARVQRFWALDGWSFDWHCAAINLLCVACQSSTVKFNVIGA